MYVYEILCIFFLKSYAYVYIYLEQPGQQNIFVFGEKLTFGGANPQMEFFWWDGNFLILNGSSKLWCFEWNGILSIPQVWRRRSPHEERITHVSTLKTSTKKVTNWNGINSQPNGVFFGLLSMHIWILTCYISAHVAESVWISQKWENARMAVDTARIPPNSWNGSLWLRRQKLLKRR